MKKIIVLISIIVGIAIIAGGAILIFRLLSGPEDTWLCQNGQWTRHGNPSAPMPTTGCGTPIIEPDVVVTSPQPNQTVTNPIALTGKAKGFWFFEATAPVKLFDDKENQIAESHIQAQGDWMTNHYVPFTGTLNYSVNATTSGTLLFQNDNPSGLPQNQKEFRVPIVIAPTDTITVKAYFNNNNLDPQISCNKVFPNDREVPKTNATARAALEELLKGPTDKEKNAGYYTNINPGVKIQSLTITNGAASADFDKTLEQDVGGSCKVAAIRAQITETLKQFPNVTSVIISINGRTKDILQP